MEQKVSKPSWSNMIFTNQNCEASARRSVNPTHAATNRFSNSNLTSLSRSLLFKRPLKLPGICLLFWPKFHCKLNPIEYFWGMVKKCLHDNCDYSFDGLKENLPKVLDSVPIQTIHRWEHRLFRWMEAYRAGLGSVQAQLQVKKFSSRKYKSHRCI